jgi:single-stranded-DNA-specific exonuclease
MTYEWRFKPPVQEERVAALAEQINVQPFIAQLLIQRGINDFEKAKKFFRPDLSDLHDPFLMKDMREAVDRLTSAIFNGEKIMIYGDYDVDGTTSVAMMYSFLKNMGQDVEFYIPDRYKEGYGLSELGVRTASDSGCKLMVALDCGITAIDEVELATELGLDLIICDHHKPGKNIPNATAVLDPLRVDCDYPYKHLSGCGVGFKLLQALTIDQSLDENVLYSYLDLLCISIGADIVAMTGENRVLAYFGLEKIRNDPRPGITSLFNHAGFNKSTVTISDVVFTLAPRINAAGRVKSARSAVKVMIADSIEEGNAFAKVVEQNNLDRRELDKEITTQALAQIENNKWYQDAWSTVVYGEGWHKGVIGIVASRLIDNYYRPTIVLTKSGDTVTGSARSNEGLDIYQCLSECTECMIQFGGHTMAAGMTMKEDQVEPFKLKFDEVVRTKLEQAQLSPVVEIDREIGLDDINDRGYRILRQFAPFGPGNMKPVFMTKDLVNAKWSRAVGDEGAHLKLHVRQIDSKTPEFNGIGFRMGNWAEYVLEGKPFDAVYTLEENEWKGKVSLQLNVKDLHTSD